VLRQFVLINKGAGLAHPNHTPTGLISTGSSRSEINTKSPTTNTTTKNSLRNGVHLMREHPHKEPPDQLGDRKLHALERQMLMKGPRLSMNSGRRCCPLDSHGKIIHPNDFRVLPPGTQTGVCY